MRRLPSWLIVAGVAAVVALGVADTIRPHGEPRVAQTPAVPKPSVRGMFLLPGAGCDPVAVRLPRALAERPPRMADCGGFVWSADGTLAARCRGDVTKLYGPHMETLGRFPGCAPAWRPDGALGLLRDGDLVVARRHGTPRVFVSGAQLAQAMANRLGGRYALVDIAWIDTARFAGIVQGRKAWQQAVVVASTDGVEWVVRELGQRISNVSASPHGNVAFARNRLGREFVALSPDGREAPLPRIANTRAIAWSPDDGWVALATRTATFIARTGSREVALRIPLGGESLVWLP